MTGAVAQGYMGCCRLGPWGQVQGCQDSMRCVKYEENEETVGELHKVPYILPLLLLLLL